MPVYDGGHMPYQTKKLDTAQALTLEWILQVKNYKLTLDRAKCVGCQICSLACPKAAITLIKQPKTADGAAQKAKVDVDLAKCNFCGICEVTCPYGAVKVSRNCGEGLNVVAKESFPELVRDIKIDSAKQPQDPTACEEVCPLGLIHVKGGKLAIDAESCPTCRACEYMCPDGLIKVRKTYEGKISIDQTKCPEGCHDCVDVCPIKGTLTFTDGKVTVNEATCTYCGACKVVCPVDDALQLKRTKVLHKPVHSGTWNKALERLTSPADAAKELKAIGGLNAKKAVEKRFAKEDDIP
jgi:4Fe-4S ferredoxin